MFRIATILAVIIALLTSSAYADVDSKRYSNLSKVNCEDPQTIADLEEIWTTMTLSNGRSTLAALGYAKVLSSKSRTKTKNKLTCSARVKTIYGVTRGMFIFTVFSTGKWVVEFHPGY